MVPTFCEGTSLRYAISFHLACETANRIHRQCELINMLAATLHKLMVWSHGFFVGLHLWIACFPHVNLCLTPWVVYTRKLSLWSTCPSFWNKCRYLFSPSSSPPTLQPAGRLESSRWKKNAVVMVVTPQPGNAGWKHTLQFTLPSSHLEPPSGCAAEHGPQCCGWQPPSSRAPCIPYVLSHFNMVTSSLASGKGTNSPVLLSAVSTGCMLCATGQAPGSHLQAVCSVHTCGAHKEPTWK